MIRILQNASRFENKHKDIQILQSEIDDRLNIYDAEEMKQLSCRKMRVELPIDYEGNVYIWLFDL